MIVGDICGYHGNFDLKSEADSSSGRVSERRLVKIEISACFWSDGYGNFVRLSNGNFGVDDGREVFSACFSFGSPELFFHPRDSGA
ncbi:hypothetical protein Tco_0162654 [Tanacetum coccineum]